MKRQDYLLKFYKFFLYLALFLSFVALHLLAPLSPHSILPQTSIAPTEHHILRDYTLHHLRRTPPTLCTPLPHAACLLHGTSTVIAPSLFTSNFSFYTLILFQGLFFPLILMLFVSLVVSFSLIDNLKHENLTIIRSTRKTLYSATIFYSQ